MSDTQNSAKVPSEKPKEKAQKQDANPPNTSEKKPNEQDNPKQKVDKNEIKDQSATPPAPTSEPSNPKPPKESKPSATTEQPKPTDKPSETPKETIPQQNIEKNNGKPDQPTATPQQQSKVESQPQVQPQKEQQPQQQQQAQAQQPSEQKEEQKKPKPEKEQQQPQQPEKKQQEVTSQPAPENQQSSQKQPDQKDQKPKQNENEAKKPEKNAQQPTPKETPTIPATDPAVKPDKKSEQKPDNPPKDQVAAVKKPEAQNETVPAQKKDEKEPKQPPQDASTNKQPATTSKEDKSKPAQPEVQKTQAADSKKEQQGNKSEVKNDHDGDSDNDEKDSKPKKITTQEEISDLFDQIQTKRKMQRKSTFSQLAQPIKHPQEKSEEQEDKQPEGGESKVKAIDKNLSSKQIKEASPAESDEEGKGSKPAQKSSLSHIPDSEAKQPADSKPKEKSDYKIIEEIQKTKEQIEAKNNGARKSLFAIPSKVELKEDEEVEELTQGEKKSSEINPNKKDEDEKSTGKIENNEATEKIKNNSKSEHEKKLDKHSIEDQNPLITSPETDEYSDNRLRRGQIGGDRESHEDREQENLREEMEEQPEEQNEISQPHRKQEKQPPQNVSPQKKYQVVKKNERRDEFSQLRKLEYLAAKQSKIKENRAVYQNKFLESELSKEVKMREANKKKRELEAMLINLNREIQMIQQLDNNHSSIERNTGLPQSHLANSNKKDSSNSKDPIERVLPPIKKNNQIKEMIKIAEDKKARQEAVSLVNRIKKDKLEMQQKKETQFHKMAEMISKNNSLRREQHEAQQEQLLYERRQKVSHRLERKELFKQENLKLISASKNFVKDLHRLGPSQIAQQHQEAVASLTPMLDAYKQSISQARDLQKQGDLQSGISLPNLGMNRKQENRLYKNYLEQPISGNDLPLLDNRKNLHEKKMAYSKSVQQGMYKKLAREAQHVLHENYTSNNNSNNRDGEQEVFNNQPKQNQSKNLNDQSDYYDNQQEDINIGSQDNVLSPTLKRVQQKKEHV